MSNAVSRQSNNQACTILAQQLIEKVPFLLRKLESLSFDHHIPSFELLVEVIKFLNLVSKNNMRLTPSQSVDLGWHEFILFTKSYSDFCHEELGRFIHHTPDDNKVTNERNYLKTIHCYFKWYGEPPESIWGELSQTEWVDSQCGSCKSN